MPNCVICNRAFFNKNPLVKTCSTECSKALLRQNQKQFHLTNDYKYAEQRKQWAQANRDKMNEYQRKYHAKKLGEQNE